VVLYIPPKGDLARELGIGAEGEIARAKGAEAGGQWTLREFGLGAQVLSDLGVQRIRLLSNSQTKIVGLTGFGLQVVERIGLMAMKGEA
jgi:3,4-dihydroxy 2-butanone 4-phosphate synthase/GTP cyclohydrolase II